MKKDLLIFFSICLLMSLLLLPAQSLLASSEPSADMERIFVSGEILDSHKEPVKEAEVKVLINGQPHKFIVEHKEVNRDLISRYVSARI
jgi:hypothetical protein